MGSSVFLDQLSLADVIPLHKKGNTLDKGNYRPINLLPVVSKLFERLIAKQFQPFLNSFLSKYLCGFRRGYSCQYALLNMLLQWQKSLSNSDKVGAILMDLSKAFDCLPHDLLIAKLAAHGVRYDTLKLLHSYLSDRKQRVRIGSSFSEWLDVVLGVPQGSVLGPILFNVFINDLLSSVLECIICNFADDNTLVSCKATLDEVLESLHSDMASVLSWFKYNGLVANPEKFQMLILGIESRDIVFKIGTTNISPSKEVKLLGITLDDKLSFYSHIKGLCHQASLKTKVSQLARHL